MLRWRMLFGLLLFTTAGAPLADASEPIRARLGKSAGDNVQATTYRTEFQFGKLFRDDSSSILGGIFLVEPSPHLGFGLGIHKFTLVERDVLSYLLLAEAGSSHANWYGVNLLGGIGGNRFEERTYAMGLLGAGVWVAPLDRLLISARFNNRFFKLSPERGGSSFQFGDITGELALSIGYRFGGSK